MQHQKLEVRHRDRKWQVGSLSISAKMHPKDHMSMASERTKLGPLGQTCLRPRTGPVVCPRAENFRCPVPPSANVPAAWQLSSLACIHRSPKVHRAPLQDHLKAKSRAP